MTLLFVSSCAFRDVVVSGTVTPEIDPTKVKVYLMDNPPCDVELVADIRIPGDYFSRSSLIDAFKESAAKFGAPIIQVTTIVKLNITEYQGTARALRCIPYAIEN